jgi:hypothetical protein
MTLRYAHLAPQHLRAGIAALEAPVERPDPGRGRLSTETRVTLESRDFAGSA